MKQVTLTNNFHNTSVNIRVPDAIVFDSMHDVYAELQLLAAAGDQFAKRTVRRIDKILCGSKTCMCGKVR